MKKRQWGYALCSFGAVLCAVLYGVHAVSNETHYFKTFSADIGRAFSATFLKQEKVVGEFDFAESKENTGSEPVVECVFDSVASPRRTNVIFNEIAWMGSKDSYKDEWIEIKNISDATINLSSWKIKDRGDISFSFSKGTEISSGGIVVIKKKNDSGDIFGWSGSLKNDGEYIRLFNASCELEDEAGGATWEAGDNKTKQTMERNAKRLGWHTSAFPGGTQGKENSVPQSANRVNTETQKENDNKNIATGVATGTTTTVNVSAPKEIPDVSVFIEEVVAGKEGNAMYEFIKLKNPSKSTVALTGWMIQKKSSTGKETMLVSKARFEGKMIVPDGYFILANEGGYSGDPKPDVWWPKSYTLAQSNNAVALYDAYGKKISEYAW